MYPFDVLCGEIGFDIEARNVFGMYGRSILTETLRRRILLAGKERCRFQSAPGATLTSYLDIEKSNSMVPRCETRFSIRRLSLFENEVAPVVSLCSACCSERFPQFHQLQHYT